MSFIAPYQSGVWLAEYVDIRCQLCRMYRSAPQSHLSLLNHQRHNATAHSFSLLKAVSGHFNSGLLCTRCHEHISWLPTTFEVDIASGTTLPIQAATYYEYPIRQAIRAFKHHEDMTKLPLLIHVLRQLPRPHGCHYDNSVIIAMPTTDQRLSKRGFDPVSILSAHLSQHWNIPLWSGVARVDDTMSQQGLSRAERLTNLNDAFEVTHQPKVKKLLLFDDVATTGASLQALGRTLYIDTHRLDATPTQYDNQIKYDNQTQLLAFALAHGSR